MEEILTCTVCCEQYQEKMRHPVLLPRCGHSFCRPCISFLVKNGCVICPTCRMDQRVETADHLPTEFSLLAITSVQQVTKMEMCERHAVKLSFWCKTCSEAACGECLFEDHPTHAHKIIKSTAYILEMRDAVKDITSKFVDALDLRERWYHQQIFHSTKTINDAIRTLSVLRRDMEDARDLLKGAKTVEGIAPTTALSDASKCLALKWNLKDCNLDLSRNDGIRKGKTTKEEKDKEEAEATTKPKVPGDGEGKAEDAEREKDTSEKAKDEKEKESKVEEPEILTEEEKKKRKMQRVKEKLAAAAAAAEKVAAGTEKDPAASKERDRNAKEKTDEKSSSKEKTDTKEKATNSSDQETALTIGAAKTRSLARKYAPVPREPSVTPEKEVRTQGNRPSAPPEKADKEDQEKKDNEKKKEADVNSKATDEAENTREADVVSNSESQPSKEDESTTPDKGTESPSSSQPDADSVTEGKVVTEGKGKTKKETSSGVTRRPRGRLARQALKRSQTMNLSSTSDDKDAEEASHSDNIRGLDLETTNLGKNEEPPAENKDTEEQAKSEEKEVEEKAEEQKEDKEEETEQEVTAEEGQADKPMFEMEPEEKERIATELMQVPSLTVIVEGIGGRLASMAWEPMGLHVYCHQYQELPYDVIIKSTVLDSLIPTKSPMVFLDVGTEQKTLGRVYISLWGHLRRSSNFLHLCLGDRGPSYRNTMFLEVLNPDCPGERIKGGDYDYNNGRGGEALLDDLEFHEGYSMPMESGMVTAGGPCNRDQDSQFFICTEDDLDRNFACPFGRVVSGLYVMKEAVWLVVTRQIWIRDCGVVLDAPKF